MTKTRTRPATTVTAAAALAAAIVALLLLAGCPASRPSPTPEAAASTAPATAPRPATAEPPAASPAAGPAYATYANARFGYAVDYPADLLTPRVEADNGDGQRFASADGKAEMRAYGRHDLSEEMPGGDAATPAEAAERVETAAGRKVTYRAKGPGWFVISGLDGEAVFYRRTLVRDGVLVTASLEYPQARRAVFDTVAAKVAASLRWSPTTPHGEPQ